MSRNCPSNFGTPASRSQPNWRGHSVRPRFANAHCVAPPPNSKASKGTALQPSQFSWRRNERRFSAPFSRLMAKACTLPPCPPFHSEFRKQARSGPRRGDLRWNVSRSCRLAAVLARLGEFLWSVYFRPYRLFRILDCEILWRIARKHFGGVVESGSRKMYPHGLSAFVFPEPSVNSRSGRGE